MKAKPIVYVCGIHRRKYMIQSGRSLLYYMCPEYKGYYREGEKPCTNHISRAEIKKIQADIMMKYQFNELTKGYENIVLSAARKNKKRRYEQKAIIYKVLDINDDYIEVGIWRRDKIMDDATLVV